MKHIGINPATFQLPIDQFLKVHKSIANDIDLTAEWQKMNPVILKSVTDDHSKDVTGPAGKAKRKRSVQNSSEADVEGNSEPAAKADVSGETV